MEGKLPNDRLEEFLRRSLDGHSEEPPSDMWSKIAGGLDAAPISPKLVSTNATKIRFLSKWWSATAVAATVLGLFLVQHLYFENRIDKLTKDLEQATVQVQQQETNNQIENSEIGSSETAPAPTSKTNLKASEDAVLNSPNPYQPTPAPANNAKSKKQLPIQGSAQNKTSPEVPSSLQEEGVAVGQKQESLVPIQQDENKVKGESLVENETQTEQSNLEKIWLKPIRLTAGTATSPLAKPVLPIEPLRNRSRLTIGVNAMPMVSWSKIQSVKQDQPEPGMPNGKKSFAVDVENSGLAWLAGINLEASITPRLNIGSGLGFRSVSYQSTHTMCLDFRDRKGGPPGPPHNNDHEHDFQYELNTGVGTIEMEVRAESDEIAQNIPDNEKVEAKVKTSQELSYVTVPFYANYSLGKGRLRAIAKGGIVMNFLQIHKFSVDDITPVNEKFMFTHREDQRGTQSDLQTVSVDYMAGIGMEYRLTENASLRLEPTIIGSLTSTHNNPRIESSEIAAGLNLGMTYSF